LDYFEEIGARHFILEAYDIVLFVYFFEEAAVKKYSGQHSVATRRKKRGVVFSPLAPDSMDRCCTLVAHELCHTTDATDKDVGEQSLHPDGLAEPDRRPLYPQGKAEVMALGIPEARGVERRVEELTQCVIGRKTAEEVGWASMAGSP